MVISQQLFLPIQRIDVLWKWESYRQRAQGLTLCLGTDPDSDCVGIAVKTADGYQLMSGNQVGALLMHFILTHTNLSKYPHPAVVKTVVTSELGAKLPANTELLYSLR